MTGMTFGSLFTGFGGADLGAMMAGLTPIWGVELDPKIAGVGNRNLGGHIRIADVLGEDPRNYDRVDVFHASPPCPNFSVAKTGGEETALDLALASKVAEFITTLQPKIATIENVIAYRKSKSRAIIERTLNTLGYWLSVDLVNFADLGVPQTRTRMIVRAIKGGFVPYMPQPEPWIGWYEAIRDLIPTLPDSQFAPWQLARIPEELKEYILVMTEHHTHSDQGREGRGGVIPESCPANTVLPGSGTARAMVQSCLIGGANTSERDAHEGVGVSQDHEPTLCVNSSNSLSWRAYLVDSQNARDIQTVRRDSEPAFTQTVYSSKHQPPRAFICEGSAAGEDNKFTMPIRMEDEPIFTQRAIQNNPRAFIMGKTADKFGDGIRYAEEPVQTITANEHGSKGYSSGRVVAMTPRCMARFQSFPDHYVLPENKTLACKGIGNAVPPLGYAKIVKSLL